MTVKEFAEKYAGRLVDVPELVTHGVVIGYEDAPDGECVLVAVHETVNDGWPLQEVMGEVEKTFEPAPDLKHTRGWWFHEPTEDDLIEGALPVRGTFLKSFFIGELPPFEKKDNPHPHRCPACGCAAYVGVVPAAVDCVSWSCVHGGQKRRIGR